ncbi:MAG: DNA polymerase/3'-5' exonuclease PolX [Myxococcota bacterium]|nr:DNA polymerase/3'-5' exonuclease PolX [Myxococcota bacterium]
MATARQIAEALREIGVLLELKGENPFKVRAYENGARAVEQVGDAIVDRYRDGALGEVKGIGQALQEKIGAFIESGHIPLLDQLRAEHPPGLLELLAIPGLGPKRVREIHDMLGVASISELEYACKENRLRLIKGFGEKLQAKVLDGIRFIRASAGRKLISDVWPRAVELREQVAGLPGVERCDIAGSLRRRRETVKDIDLTVASSHPEQTVGLIARLKGIEELTGHGPTKVSFRLKGGLAADVRIVEPGQYAFLLQHMTGGMEHNAALRGHAKSLGLRLSEYGLFRGEELIPAGSEAEIYAALGMDFIPPEMREGRGEIEAALEHRLPRLIEDGDLRGAFHNHTNWSDGANSIEEMAAAAEAKGLRYFHISDHSRAAVYANGLDVERLSAQLDEIHEVQKRHPKLRILTGIEVDILKDGGLDLPGDILSRLDVVIASVHSRFGQSREEMTERLVRAASHPHVDILGHPTGRLLLGREPYDFDFDAVARAAAANHTALELNANPHRLDLEPDLLRRAKQAGARIAINADAHSREGLDDLPLGVATARRGWLEKTDIVNTWPIEEVLAYFQR